LPFQGQNCGTYGIVYSLELQALFINHNDCSGKLSTDAVWTISFDYTKE